MTFRCTPRTLFPIAIIAGGLLLLCVRLASADTAPTPTPVPVAIDWQIWIALGIAALAGVRAIVDTLLAFFKTEAPLTKTPIDDHFRDGFQKVHDRLDKLDGTVNGLVDLAKPPGGIRVLPGGSGTATMLAVLLLGALVVPALTSCATGKAALAEGSVAFLECEDGHLDAAALADAKSMASTELRHLLAGGPAVNTTALKADLAPLKSDLARCGWAAAIAALGALLPTSTPGIAVSALAAGPDPAQARTAFAVAARQLGWAPVRLADGTVL